MLIEQHQTSKRTSTHRQQQVNVDILHRNSQKLVQNTTILQTSTKHSTVVNYKKEKEKKYKGKPVAMHAK